MTGTSTEAPKTPITIDARSALAAAEKAFKDKKLQFFDEFVMDNPSVSSRACTYLNPRGFVCALGASLPKEVALENNKLGVLGLLDNKIIRVPEQDVDFIADLQSAHDSAVTCGSLKTAKEYFKEKLTILKERYNLN